MQDTAGYTPEANLLIQVAEQGFFFSIGEETKRTVAVLLSSMFLVDRHLDSLNPDLRLRSEKEILSFLSHRCRPLHEIIIGDARDSLQDLKKILLNLSDSQQREFLSSVDEVFENGKIVATTKDRRRFIIARKREARATADMVLTLAPQLGENKAFAEFLRDVTISESLLDSIKDARRDRKRGEIAIKPVQLYFHLAMGTLKHATAAAKAHPHKVTFLRTGMHWTWQHVKASVTVRTSSLRNVCMISRIQWMRSLNRSPQQIAKIKSLFRPHR